MSAEENKALARRFIEEVINEGNMATVDELVDPDWVDHDPNSPEEIRGIEGSKQFYGDFRSAFPDIQVTDSLAQSTRVTSSSTLGTVALSSIGVGRAGDRLRNGEGGRLS
jgi:hypothetical protein